MKEQPQKITLPKQRGGLFKIDQGILVWVLAAIPILYIAFIVPKAKSQYTTTFALSLALAIILYKFNVYMIPQFKDSLLKAGLSGKDLNKPGTAEQKQAM